MKRILRVKDAFSSFAEVCYKPLGDKGEDAFAYDFSRQDIHAQAVFDGCGGAGAWKYPEFKNASGAFVSAQSVAKLFLKWAEGLTVSSLQRPQNVAQDFHDKAKRLLEALKQDCAPMGVSGSLVKSFPCTASVALSTVGKNNSISLTALNAGDSRIYFLTPEDGLIQLTKDDSRGNPDPLQSLRDSAPLSNLLNADKEFRVTASHVVLKMPCAIICATDGAFGFLRSPMDFEYLLLKSLVQASSVADFEASFESAIREVTGDDSTLIMSFYGWNSYGRIRDKLTARLKYVEQLINAIDAAGEDRERMEEVISQQWTDYRRQTVYYENLEKQSWKG